MGLNVLACWRVNIPDAQYVAIISCSSSASKYCKLVARDQEKNISSPLTSHSSSRLICKLPSSCAEEKQIFNHNVRKHRRRSLPAISSTKASSGRIVFIGSSELCKSSRAFKLHDTGFVLHDIDLGITLLIFRRVHQHLIYRCI